MFHLLQCRRRRLVLKYLQEYTGEKPVVMSDIAEHIAALEHDTTVRALRSQERQRVYIALYQSHLPKMDKAGIINYNQNRGYVEPTALTAEFTPYLTDEPSVLPADETESETEAEVEAEPQAEVDAQLLQVERDSAWPRRYMAAAGVSATGVAALGVAGSSLALPSGISIAVIAGVLFTLLAAVHWVAESTDN
ncbi:DUF7344 domain-containing protein [Halorientalis salina]|uniref:DUF7344 domain-containing protein n=1 Tax=Halorientalis salina TaxID=2932266 RepID=UPI003FD8A20D